MRATLVLLAEQGVSQLRGTAGWEEIAAAAGLELPIDPEARYPDDSMNAIGERLAELMATDRSTALRAIGEHGFRYIVNAVPEVFAAEHEDATPAQHTDWVFQQLSSVVAGLFGDDADTVHLPQMAWTREGRRREFTVRSDPALSDVIEGQIVALLDWIGVESKFTRMQLSDTLCRFELWYD